MSFQSTANEVRVFVLSRGRLAEKVRRSEEIQQIVVS